MKDNELIGKIFGRWTVLSIGTRKRYFLCQCSCEKQTIKEVRKSSLEHYETSSCGCITRERSTKHKKYGTKIYSTWRRMKGRCYHKNRHDYHIYGGRGITVCDEWKNNFENFLKWANENNFKDDLQIDRIDPNKGYCPENCRFVTPRQNSYNRRGYTKSTSKYKGVHFDKYHNKYKASIMQYNKSTFIGYFTSESEAAKAYNKKAIELFGEFAYLNKIEE